MTLLRKSSKIIGLTLFWFFASWPQNEKNMNVILHGSVINVAFSENGLLPYQLCGSNESNLGAGIAFSSFIHDGVEQLITVTASSSWGEGASLPRVEFLAYFRPLSTKHSRCPGDLDHCEFLPRGAPIISPNVTCRVVGAQSRPGYLSIPAADSLRRYCEGGLFSVVNIMCPSLELDLPLFGMSKVELYIGDGNESTFSLNLCYIHVTSIRRVSLCTEPLAGINKNDSNSLAFWRGITNVWPNGYHGHTLLDAFLKYHMNVLGLHVTLNTYMPDEFTHHIQKYLGPSFSYRAGWNLPGLGISNSYLNYEILSEATCQWEHRLDSQWVVVVHAPDNYIFPRNYGETLDNVLDRLDPNVFSGVEIPMMLSHSRNSTNNEAENVLQRWRVLDEKDDPFESKRGIPLLNPRHSTHSCIHFNAARTEDFKENLVGADVIQQLSLIIVHIMAITRPELNKAFIDERGDFQTWFDVLGRQLEKELMTKNRESLYD
jgi:hypothetical protein